jgi:Ankyrin repeats (3 copies)
MKKHQKHLDRLFLTNNIILSILTVMSMAKKVTRKRDQPSSIAVMASEDEHGTMGSTATTSKSELRAKRGRLSDDDDDRGDIKLSMMEIDHGAPEAEDNIQVLIVDIHRILYAIDNYETTKVASADVIKGSDAMPLPTASDYVARANLAQAKLQRLVDLLENSGEKSLNIEEKEQLNSFRVRVKAAMDQAHAIASTKSLNEKDIVRRIFGQPKTCASVNNDNEVNPSVNARLSTPPPGVSSTFDVRVVSPQQSASVKVPAPVASIAKPSAVIASVEDIQAVQREQMEEAIAQMASQMKIKTQTLHATLTKQTDGVLNEMEAIAEDNVTAVSTLAKDTNEHLRKSWSSTVSTWVTIVSVVAMFAFGLITIFMIPKKSTKQLFSRPIWSKASSPTATKLDISQWPSEYEEYLQNMLAPNVDLAKMNKADNHDPELLVDELSTRLLEVEVKNDSSNATQIRAETIQATTGLDIDEAVYDTTHNVAQAEIMSDGSMQQETVISSITHDVANDESITKAQQDHDDDDSLIELPEVPHGSFQPRDVALAAATGKHHLLRVYLLQRRGWIDVQDHNGWAPIHEATMMGQTKSVEVLMENGCNLRLLTNDGLSPLDIAKTYLDIDSAIVKLLVAANDSRFEAHDATEATDSTASEIGLDRQFMVEPMGNINKSMNSRITSSELREAAVEEGNGNALRQILQQKGDDNDAIESILNAPDENGWTALHLAVDAGNYDNIKILLENGADYTILTQYTKNSALDIAYNKYGGDDPITQLLEHYEDIAE